MSLLDRLPVLGKIRADRAVLRHVEDLERRGQEVERISEPFGFSASQTFTGLHTGTQPAPDALLANTTGWAASASAVIADRVGGLPMEFGRVTGTDPDDFEAMPNHPFQELLDDPAPELMDCRAWKRLTTQWILATGEAYHLLLRDMAVPGIVRELAPMPPQYVTPIVDHGRIPAYDIRPTTGVWEIVPREDVLRVWNPDPQSLYTSEGTLGPQAIPKDGDKFAAEHARSHFQHDAVPPITIEASGVDQADAPPRDDVLNAFHEDWLQRYHRRFGSKRGLPVFLARGWTAKSIVAGFNGQQIVPLQEHWRDQLLMSYRVSRAVLGQVVAGDRSSAEVMMWAFDRQAVLPITAMIAEAITRQVIPDGVRSGFRVRFRKFVSDDKAFDLAQEEQDLARGVRTVNEIRERRDLEPAEWGDLPRGTFGEAPYLGEVPEEPEDDAGEPNPFEEDEPDEDEDEEAVEDEEEEEDTERSLRRGASERADAQMRALENAFLPRFSGALGKFFRMQRDEALRRLASAGPPSRAERQVVEDLFDPTDWQVVGERLLGPSLRGVFEGTFLRLLGDLPGPQAAAALDRYVFAEEQVAILERIAGNLVKEIGDTTQKNLQRELGKAVAQGEPHEKVVARVAEVFKGRKKAIRTIARTEIGIAQSTANVEAMDAGGIQRLMWIHVAPGEGAPPARHNHQLLDRVEVSRSEGFDLGTGEFASVPRLGMHGARLSAGESINCRCDAVAVV